MKPIRTQQMGEVWIASDGVRSAIGKTKQDAIYAVEHARSLKSGAGGCVVRLSPESKAITGDAFALFPKPDDVGSADPNACPICNHSKTTLWGNYYRICANCDTVFSPRNG